MRWFATTTLLLAALALLALARLFEKPKTLKWPVSPERVELASIYARVKAEFR